MKLHRALIIAFVAFAFGPTVLAADRPMKWSGTGQPCDINCFDIEGHATHLGAYHEHMVFTDTIVVIGTDLLIFPGYSIYTAANGDRLFASFELRLHTTTDIFDGTVTFAGGTGRFADASGTGTFSGNFDMDTGSIKIAGQGTIGY
jgi:hypothetical protein